MSSPSSAGLESIKRVLRRTRRWAYGLRAHVPGLRRHHRYEILIGPVGFWNALARYQFRVLEVNGLLPRHTLLDIGCGPLQGGIPFIRYLDAGNYTGVEIEQERFDAARDQVVRHRLSDRRPRVILASDFGDAQLGASTFDFVWASQVLYYFPDALMHELLAFASKRLNPNGKFLGDIIHPDHFTAQDYSQSRFLRQTPEHMQALAETHGLQARSLGEIAQFNYPRKLTLRTNLLIEFSRKR